MSDDDSGEAEQSSRKKTSRRAPADIDVAKRSNNTCPICWMPLNIGDGVEANKWKALQMTFKGKPTFSIKKGKLDYSRAIYVYGINELTGSDLLNYQACHFVHYAQAGRYVNFNNMWSPPRTEISSVLCNDGEEPIKKSLFYNKLFGSDLRDFGIFTSAFIRAEVSSYLESAVTNSERYDFDQLHDFRNHLLSNQFVGCVDCNSKMTISEYIPLIFNALFPSNTYSERCIQKEEKTIKIKQFGQEHMLHYIMLAGCLEIDNKIDDKETDFHLDSVHIKSKTWTLRYIMMWCALQILFCNWKLNSVVPNLRHHTSYIYTGVMDLFVSVWFYALHRFESKGSRVFLFFDEFHYYYISMFPFYMKHIASPEEKNGIDCSISYLIFSKDCIGAWPSPVARSKFKLEDTQRHVNLIFGKVLGAWNEQIKPLSDAIHAGGTWNAPYSFFIDPKNLKERRDRVRNPGFGLDIKSFADEMNPFYYWFHFKHITIPRILPACKAYYDDLPANADASRQLWRRWCQYFDARVHTIGVRMLIAKRKKEEVKFLKNRMITH